MADQRSRLIMDILAKVRGVGDINRLGRAVDDVGDEMTEAAADAKLLEKSIDDVTDELRELNRVALRGGDIDLDKQRTLRSTLGQLRRIRREIGEVDEASGNVGRTLGDTLAILPAQVRGGLIVGVVGAAALAAPLLGGVIAAAVIGTVGAGGIVGGIASAARDPAVGRAAGRFVDEIERPFARLGGAFVEPVVEALDVLGDAGNRTLGQLRPDIEALAPVVVDLAEGLAGMARAATPGIAAALREAQPVLQTLARELPGLGRSLGDMLQLLADGSDDAAEALSALLTITELSIGAFARFIRGASELYGVYERLANIPILDSFLVGGIGKFITMGGDARAASKDLRGEVDLLGLAAAESAYESRAFAEDAVKLADSMYGAAQAAGGLHNALQILNGGALDVRDAERSFQAAIDDATASLEEHGRTLDIGTEAGRANQAALDAIATSAQSLATAIFEETGSQEQATAAINAGRDALIEAAREMGYNQEAAEALADEILSIPDSWGTDFDNNAPAAQRPVERYRDQIERIPSLVRTEIRTEFTSTGQPSSRVQGPNQALQLGGTVRGPAGIDRVLLRATAGEEVINAKQSRRHRGLLKAINAGAFDRSRLDESRRPLRAAASLSNGAPAATGPASLRVSFAFPEHDLGRLLKKSIRHELSTDASFRSDVARAVTS